MEEREGVAQESSAGTEDEQDQWSAGRQRSMVECCSGEGGEVEGVGVNWKGWGVMEEVGGEHREGTGSIQLAHISVLAFIIFFIVCITIGLWFESWK